MTIDVWDSHQITREVINMYTNYQVVFS